jgi:hypothetical protein
MSKQYRFQGTRYASRQAGLLCLDLTLAWDYLSLLARRLLYCRHRRNPTLLQFEDPVEDAEALGIDCGVAATRVVLNIDERMRLFYSTRDNSCDIETIRFHFEELMAPWLLDMPTFTVCLSNSFYGSYALERHCCEYPRTRDALLMESLKFSFETGDPKDPQIPTPEARVEGSLIQTNVWS